MAEATDTKSRARSAVSNGTVLLPGVDGRSAWVRRARDVLAERVADLGDDPSEAEMALAKRAAVLVTELERREVAMAQAGEANAADLDLHIRAIGALGRVLKTIGIKRKQRIKTADELFREAYEANQRRSAATGGNL